MLSGAEGHGVNTDSPNQIVTREKYVATAKQITAAKVWEWQRQQVNKRRRALPIKSNPSSTRWGIFSAYEWGQLKVLLKHFTYVWLSNKKQIFVTRSTILWQVEGISETTFLCGNSERFLSTPGRFLLFLLYMPQITKPLCAHTATKVQQTFCYLLHGICPAACVEVRFFDSSEGDGVRICLFSVLNPPQLNVFGGLDCWSDKTKNIWRLLWVLGTYFKHWVWFSGSWTFCACDPLTQSCGCRSVNYEQLNWRVIFHIKQSCEE